MARARATLDDADALIEGNRWNSALNRLYYAAFYAARALLATRELDSSRHSGVISLFQEHFVRTGIVPQETARALPRLFEKRQTTDYGDYAEATQDENRLPEAAARRVRRRVRRRPSTLTRAMSGESKRL